jgi:pimeloyl-ACP methyl ester carboxylesterase
MATYVLVHGGGHGGWCYKRVASRLRAAGHEVHTPTLTGLGERAHLLSPETDLELHIDDVARLLFYEDLRDVVLVGHSYGGMVITGVADRESERIGRLVYLDAANPKNGEANADRGNSRATRARDGRVVEGVELFMFPSPDTIRLMGVTEPGDVAWMMERLTPQPWRCSAQPLRLTDEAKLWSLPQYHIICTSTLPGRLPDVIAKARAENRLWTIDTGHDLMITEPQAVADALLQVLER